MTGWVMNSVRADRAGILEGLVHESEDLASLNRLFPKAWWEADPVTAAVSLSMFEALLTSADQSMLVIATPARMM